jgi:hypothetical protein
VLAAILSFDREVEIFLRMFERLDQLGVGIDHPTAMLLEKRWNRKIVSALLSKKIPCTETRAARPMQG